jgi:hypothetical protein
MAKAKAFALDTSGVLFTGGTGTAYTLATNEGFTALPDGLVLAFRPHVSSGAAPTLSVDGLGAVPLVSAPGVAAALTQDRVTRVTLRAGVPDFLVLGSGGVLDAPTGTRLAFRQTTAPLGWVKETDPAYNDAALRLVTGAVGEGNSAPFSTVFAGRTIAQANLPNVNLVSTSDGSHAHGFATGVDPGHTHTSDSGQPFVVSAGGSSAFIETGNARGLASTTAVGGAHAHSIIADGLHAHLVPLGGSGTPLDFAVKRVDFIVAVKA